MAVSPAGTRQLLGIIIRVEQHGLAELRQIAAADHPSRIGPLPREKEDKDADEKDRTTRRTRSSTGANAPDLPRFSIFFPPSKPSGITCVVIVVLLEQVGPPLLGAFEGLLAAPLGDLGVVAGQEDLRDLSCRERPPDACTGGTPAEAFAEGIVLGGLLVAQRPGQQPDHRVDDDHGGQLAAVEDVVANGDLLGLQADPDAFVEALVSAGDQDQALLAARSRALAWLKRSPCGVRRITRPRSGD